MANYVGRDGRVSRADKDTLEAESDRMVKRVFSNMNIVFATASNCGGGLLGGEDSFEPTVIVCDEAGQISIASLCVPLTTFTKWEGLILIGDIQQLKPPSFSGQFNEFAADAKVSPLALLAMKGVEPYLLDEQYRRAPACSAFPRTQFYDDKGLKDSDLVKRDNVVRKAVREVSLGLGVVGENGQGSEYFVTNVARGCSRVELNGTSLVNYANADTIIDIIERLILTTVVTARMIKILTYYQGQRRLLKERINSRPWPQALKDNIEIHTVDSLQGRESEVIIVDIVAAKDGLRRSRPEEQETPVDEEDVGTEDFVKVGAVTHHVREPNRLNVALTRGKDATIVVCQAALLSSTFKANRGKTLNALFNMIGDAESRKVLLEDKRIDSHPESVKARAQKSAAKLLKEEAEQKKVDLTFIATSSRRWADVRSKKAFLPAEPVKYYRTPAGHTARPIGAPKLVAEADAHDERVQLEQAKAASKATEAAREDNEKTLNLGVQESLGSSEQPPTNDSGMEVDAQGTAITAEDEGLVSESSSDGDDEMKDEKEVDERFRHLVAGGGKDQFAS